MRNIRSSKLPNFTNHLISVRRFSFNLVPVDFNAYLVSKKIDSAAFQRAEPLLWDSWRVEFEKISPASFTSQKLFLINPIRRKYRLNLVAEPTPPRPAPTEESTPAQAAAPSAIKKPGAAKPVMRPKPKIQ